MTSSRLNSFLLVAVCAFFCPGLLSDCQAQLGISYPTGFADASKLTLNGSAKIVDNALQITDGNQFEAGSAFFNARQPLFGFSTDFDFQLTAAAADGFAFVLQCDGPDALGSSGSGLGISRAPGINTGPMIEQNISIAFGLHSYYGDNGNTIRLLTNGGKYDSVELAPSAIDLHSGHRFHAHIAYADIPNDRYMRIVLTDLVTHAQFNGQLPHAQYVGIPITLFLPEESAYVGFTGATGAHTAIQNIYNWTFTPIAEPGTPTSPGPAFPYGFDSATGLAFNGGAALSGSSLQLTNGSAHTATSAYFIQKVTPNPIFYTDFDFQIENGVGDGFTFVLQNEGLDAVGSPGGGLGYGPDQPGGFGKKITNSVAVKFDLHSNAGEGGNSMGVYLNGASPTTPAIDLTPLGINLQSHHTFHVRIQYQQYGILVATIIDLNVYKMASIQYGFYDASGASPFPLTTAYAGFTAGTGNTPSSIKILNWTWTQGIYPANEQH